MIVIVNRLYPEFREQFAGSEMPIYWANWCRSNFSNASRNWFILASLDDLGNYELHDGGEESLSWVGLH